MNNLYKTISKILFLTILITLPIKVEGKTLAEFEKEVKKYTEELQEKQRNMAKNDEEVAAIERKIKKIEQDEKNTRNEIEKLKQEIIESNLKIKKKSQESKSIFEYYQISKGNNIYFEYIFGAESITDMIYRLSIVEQLVEYNEDIMKELEKLIEENQKKQQQLEQKEKELKELGINLEKEKARIDADTESLKHTLPSIEVRIKEAKGNYDYFKKLGCYPTEDIFACQFRVNQSSDGSLPSVGTFWRPMNKGYVTQGFGGRNGHRGYDLSSGNKQEPIYPIAPGVVHSIYEDNCVNGRWCGRQGLSCHGNAKIVVLRHNYNNSYIYSSYVHLGSYGNIKEGQYVGRDTIIGYMGNTGCSTGPHLHLEIANCHFKKGGGCTAGAYPKHIINPSKLINFPSRWNNR